MIHSKNAWKGRKMIAIVNIDPNPRESGFHLYEIRINRKPITRFMHKREDDLSVCLGIAAKAVEFIQDERMEWKNEP
jgi:hypothetical protein